MYRCLVGNVDREGAVSLLRYVAHNILRYAAHNLLRYKLKTYKETCSGMQLTLYSGTGSQPILRNLLRFSAHTLLRYKLTIY